MIRLFAFLIACVLIIGAFAVQRASADPAAPPAVCDFLGTLGHCPTATNTPPPTNTPVPTDTPTPAPTVAPTPIVFSTYVVSAARRDSWVAGGSCGAGDCTGIWQVLCDVGDFVTSGFYDPSGGNAVSNSKPLTGSLVGVNGWQIDLGQNIATGNERVFAVCLDNPPLH